jgi:putative flippase GtrA
VRVGRALAGGRLPVSDLRAQLGRAPLQPRAADVPIALTRQLARFAVVGAASTLAYLSLFLLLQPGVGAQSANLLALLITAVANTAANRRFTFGVRGRAKRATHQAQGLVVFALGLGLTSGSLALVHATGATARTTEASVLVSANLLATLLRFLLMRAWVFGRRPAVV